MPEESSQSRPLPKWTNWDDPVAKDNISVSDNRLVLSAIPDREVDFFDRGNLDPYNVVSDDDAFEIQQSVVFKPDDYESQYALEASGTGTTELLFSEFGEGLENYPEFGNTIEWRQRSSSSNPTRQGIQWGTDFNGGNQLENCWLVDHNGGEYRMFEREDDSATQIMSESGSIPADEWTHWVLETDEEEEKLEITVYDSDGDELVNGTGSTSLDLNNPGWAWRNANNNQTGYFDFAYIND